MSNKLDKQYQKTDFDSFQIVLSNQDIDTVHQALLQGFLLSFSVKEKFPTFRIDHI